MELVEKMPYYSLSFNKYYITKKRIFIRSIYLNLPIIYFITFSNLNIPSSSS